MAVPQNKTELLKAINDSFSKLQKDLLAVPLSAANEGSMEGDPKGTLMSVSNLIAYLVRME